MRMLSTNKRVIESMIGMKCFHFVVITNPFFELVGVFSLYCFACDFMSVIMTVLFVNLNKNKLTDKSE